MLTGQEQNNLMVETMRRRRAMALTVGPHRYSEWPISIPPRRPDQAAGLPPAALVDAPVAAAEDVVMLLQEEEPAQDSAPSAVTHHGVVKSIKRNVELGPAVQEPAGGEEDPIFVTNDSVKDAEKVWMEQEKHRIAELHRLAADELANVRMECLLAEEKRRKHTQQLEMIEDERAWARALSLEAEASSKRALLEENEIRKKMEKAVRFSIQFVRGEELARRQARMYTENERQREDIFRDTVQERRMHLQYLLNSLVHGARDLNVEELPPVPVPAVPVSFVPLPALRDIPVVTIDEEGVEVIHEEAIVPPPPTLDVIIPDLLRVDPYKLTPMEQRNCCECEEAATCIVIDCGHLVLCGECSNDVRNTPSKNKCPVCGKGWYDESGKLLIVKVY
jgi:Zinc finger, C3HC4 type (RING finger)